MMTERKFIFPITTGRSGTVFLTELLKANLRDAEIFHERAGYANMGFDTPDASHMRQFNTVGNSPHVQDFWRLKCARVISSPKPVYTEISHFLAKGGLIENITPLANAGQVHLIILRRDIEKILWSLVNRFDFFNNGFTWLFNLDPNYPNVLINAAPFRAHGMQGNALWFIHEMFARMEYYKLLCADMHNVHLHEFDLSDIIKPQGALRLLRGLGNPVRGLQTPPKANATKQEFFGDQMRKDCAALVRKFKVDHAAIAKIYFDSGRRLAAGPRMAR